MAWMDETEADDIHVPLPMIMQVLRLMEIALHAASMTLLLFSS